jgi:hypothetical protein
MPLQCKGAGDKLAPLSGNGVFVDYLVIHLDSDLVPVDGDVLRKPLIVFSWSFLDILDSVYTSCPAPIRVTVIDLDLISFFGKSDFLVFRVNVHS